MSVREYLTIELGEEFTVLTRPNSNRAVLATCENVVGIRVNGGYGATVSVIDFPQLGAPLDIKAAEETVTPACDHSLVVLGYGAADTAREFCGLEGHYRLVLGKIPNLDRATFIDGGKNITVSAEGKIVDTRAVSIRVQHERQVIAQHTIHLSRDSADNQLLLVVTQVN